MNKQTNRIYKQASIQTNKEKTMTSKTTNKQTSIYKREGNQQPNNQTGIYKQASEETTKQQNKQGSQEQDGNQINKRTRIQRITHPTNKWNKQRSRNEETIKLTKIYEQTIKQTKIWTANKPMNKQASSLGPVPRQPRENRTGPRRRDPPGAEQFARPLVRVPSSSVPSASTHQQWPVEPLHCARAYFPSGLQLGKTRPKRGSDSASSYLAWHGVKPADPRARRSAARPRWNARITIAKERKSNISQEYYFQ